MQHRRLGRTGLDVSVVGFGTCQLRMVPERQAIDTLIRGFELGVDIVHTAPDYEGAEDLVARAIRESGRKVTVCTQAYDMQGNRNGPVTHFERLFETACERFDRERLELFGIACIDDRELLGENVWGSGGMIEFLQTKKAEGRIGATFCTTHGNPAFLRRLLEADVFDALMLAYNPLGFHLLTVPAAPERHFENIPVTREDVFPLLRERDIGLMIMKPLAGGLLCDGNAFPPHRALAPAAEKARARDVLRAILAIPEVTCVLPGTASLAEADENAHAGWAPLIDPPAIAQRVADRAASIKASVCSRCGECESSCSQSLPVSWLFRAAYVATQRSATFETWDQVEYFGLHPHETATCATCPDVTCVCPYGIDIPRELTARHADMVDLRDHGLARPALPMPRVGDDAIGVRVLLRDVPERVATDEPTQGRIWLENAGTNGWLRGTNHEVRLHVIVGRRRVAAIELRDDVHVGGRAHFAFALPPQRRRRAFRLRLELVGLGRRWRRPRVLVHESDVAVEP